MKSWYDQKARRRSFQPGDRVLALLPEHGRPDTVDQIQFRRSVMMFITLSILLEEESLDVSVTFIC